MALAIKAPSNPVQTALDQRLRLASMTASASGTTTPGAQAYGLGSEDSGEPSALVREHKALVEKLGLAKPS